MNNIFRWIVGRPTNKQIERAFANWTPYSEVKQSRKAKEILDRERDFTALEDDWQYDVAPDGKFYLKQAKFTAQYRMRLARRQIFHLSHYITGVTSGLLRDSLPQSTEVTNTWQKQHQQQKS